MSATTTTTPTAEERRGARSALVSRISIPLAIVVLVIIGAVISPRSSASRTSPTC
ncbi:hypothetical protein [Leucobacter soli]|uniref:hypothetical protein n=1 Tax=Leucobacter soli TaxID=2812850 RepID=UPI0036098421